MNDSKPELEVNSEEIKEDINDIAGEEVAYNLQKEDPAAVPYWISTGSTLLDAIIAKEDIYGIPGGRIIELAGLPSVGKSFLSAIICSNAQDMGLLPIYMDSEYSMNKGFLEKVGVDLENFVYMEAKSVEFVLDKISHLVGEYKNMVIIWDSLAHTPVRAKREEDYKVRSDYPMKPGLLSDGFEDLQIPIGNSDSTLITLNQLRDRIPRKHESPTKAYTDPYKAPGGHAKNHTYSLRIWLTRKSSEKSFVRNEIYEVVGAKVNAMIKKSKFGSERKECNFKILWGEDVCIPDEESWLPAVKHNDQLWHKGAGWWCLEYDNGEQTKFRSTEWLDKLKQEEPFREAILELIKREKVQEYEPQELLPPEEE